MNIRKFLPNSYQYIKLPKITTSTGLLAYIVILLIGLIIFGEASNRSIVLGLKEVARGLTNESSGLMKDVENLEKENEALRSEDLRLQVNNYDEAVEKYEMVREKSKE